jgi:hypothetical protein
MIRDIRYWLGLFAIVAAISIVALWVQEKPVPNELPPSWTLEDIASQTPPYGARGRVYVLAWKILEDERPIRFESCLALKVLDRDDGYGRWCLAHLYRHPDDTKPEWQLSTIHVSGRPGTKYFPGLWIHQDKRFNERPGNEEIYASFSPEEVGWSFEQDSGFRLVDCAVCEKSWKMAIGQKPTQFFER